MGQSDQGLGLGLGSGCTPWFDLLIACRLDAEEFVTPRRKTLPCDEGGAGMEGVAHLGSEQFLELGRGFDHDRGALLAEEIEPVRPPGWARHGIPCRNRAPIASCRPWRRSRSAARRW